MRLRQSVNDFWPVFIAAHLNPTNQKLHVFGTIFMFSNFGLFALTGHGLHIALAFCGYAPSWIGHLVFEKNVPPTMRNPIVAGLCELKMVALIAAGELENEQERLFGSRHPKSGSKCIVSSEQERAYQETLRYRIREGLPSHPFDGDYWKIFLMKHQSTSCVAIHVAAMIYFYCLLAWIAYSGRYQLIVAIPLTQLVGLASHALFERNHIDFEDAIFSPRAFGCLNRMLFLVLTGRYFTEARKAASELAQV
jgi:hypothetical protein